MLYVRMTELRAVCEDDGGAVCEDDRATCCM